jgi:hypothetical protein
MLISYGANVGTYDYYNYTCVDYAREAGMAACAQFLQSKLLEQAASGGTSFRVSSQVRGGGSKFGASSTSYRQLPLIDGEWQIQFDGTSGQKYYTSLNTGEWLWEKDFLARKNPSSPSASKGGDDRYLLLGEESAGYYGYGGDSSPMADAKSSMGGDSSEKKDSTPPQPSKSNMRTASMNNMDPAVLQALLNEAKMKSEQQLEAERAENRTLISNKDGQIAKLQAVVETMTRDNAKIEVTPLKFSVLHMYHTDFHMSRCFTGAMQESQVAVRSHQSVWGPGSARLGAGGGETARRGKCSKGSSHRGRVRAIGGSREA